MPQSTKTLLYVLHSYLLSMRSLLVHDSFQRHCGIIKLIEQHIVMFLAIREDEEFEVVRLKI